jgi:methionyl-tRNA synthetase
VAVLEASRIVALLLAPVVPRVAARMLTQLGLGGSGGGGDGADPLAVLAGASWAGTAWGGLPAGHVTPAPVPVFARLDDSVPYVTQPAPGGAAAGGGGGKGGGGQGKQKQQQKQPKQPKQPRQPRQQKEQVEEKEQVEA